VNRSHNGSVVVLALFVVAFVSSMTTLIVSRSRIDSHDTIVERGRLQAFYAAEGALADLRTRLASEPDLASATFEIGRCTAEASVVRQEEAWNVTVIAKAKPFGDSSLPVLCRVKATLRGPGVPSVVRWSTDRGH